MADNHEYIASLRWAIDRQKSDLENIRKQLRRYFIAIVTIIAARLAFFLGNGNSLPIFQSSAQDSILWQMGILSIKTINEFGEMFKLFSVVFSSLALIVLLTCLYSIVYLEYTYTRSPNDDSSEIIGKQYDYLENWIEDNDRVLESVTLARERIFRLGAKSVILLITSYILQIIASESPVISFLFLGITYIAFSNLFIHDEFMSEMRLSKFAAVILIYVSIISLLVPYRIFNEGVSQWIGILWAGIAFGAIIGYLRSEIYDFASEAWERLDRRFISG